MASPTASSMSLPMSVSKMRRTGAAQTGIVQNPRAQHRKNAEQILFGKDIPTNLARIDGRQDVAPDNLVCLDLVIEIFAGANEHARTGLQVRGVDHRSTLEIARIEPQQDGFHAIQTRVQD